MSMTTKESTGISGHGATLEAPEFPAGPFQPPTARDMQLVRAAIVTLEQQRARVRAAVEGLTDQQLDTRYRNWTVRQIVHHIADSTVNYYVRWKLGMTETRPTVAPFDESLWAKLPDATRGDAALAVQLFDVTVTRLLMVIREMKDTDFDRTWFHPQYQREFPMWYSIVMYAWHTDHHLAQIAWVRANRV
ncbi:MAG: putative metal-dependent hydrolase [Phycisphaerae bacterium]|nr:putative metal-dependent hydrolase [Phycisphaerae bacterium]